MCRVVTSLISLSTSNLPALFRNFPSVISDSITPGLTIVILMASPYSTLNVSYKAITAALLAWNHGKIFIDDY